MTPVSYMTLNLCVGTLEDPPEVPSSLPPTGGADWAGASGPPFPAVPADQDVVTPCAPRSRPSEAARSGARSRLVLTSPELPVRVRAADTVVASLRFSLTAV